MLPGLFSPLPFAHFFILRSFQSGSSLSDQVMPCRKRRGPKIQVGGLVTPRNLSSLRPHFKPGSRDSAELNSGLSVTLVSLPGSSRAELVRVRMGTPVSNGAVGAEQVSYRVYGTRSSLRWSPLESSEKRYPMDMDKV